MSNFNAFPKIMKHPDHKDAVFGETIGKGLFAETPLISAARLLDVTVFTVDDEKRLASRGYRPANMANAAEYAAVILEQPDVEGYVYKEFPKWRHHPVFPSKVVNSKEEQDSMGEGWADFPVEATEEDLVKYMPEEFEKVPEVQQADDECVKLAAERAAFEAEKLALAKEKAEYEAYKAKLLEDEKSTMAITQTGVDRHGLKPENIDKRSRAYKQSQEAIGANSRV